MNTENEDILWQRLSKALFAGSQTQDEGLFTFRVMEQVRQLEGVLEVKAFSNTGLLTAVTNHIRGIFELIFVVHLLLRVQGLPHHLTEPSIPCSPPYTLSSHGCSKQQLDWKLSLECC